MSREELAELLAREIGHATYEDTYVGDVERIRYDKAQEDIIPCPPYIKIDGEIDCGKLADILFTTCPTLARMLDWLPIKNAFDDLPFEVLDADGKPFKRYVSALVYGPTWRPARSFVDAWPGDGCGGWTGEIRFAIAHTYEGKGFWTIDSDAPGDYDTHILPTHYVRLEPPSSQALLAQHFMRG